jgi:hypothetical protein
LFINSLFERNIQADKSHIQTHADTIENNISKFFILLGFTTTFIRAHNHHIVNIAKYMNMYPKNPNNQKDEKNITPIIAEIKSRDVNLILKANQDIIHIIKSKYKNIL